MTSDKIRVFYFNNGSGGGVLSVIRNLLQYNQGHEIENNIIYTINQHQVNDFKKTVVPGAASEQVFYYSPKWNFYHTCKRLAKLLPNEKAVIVANDWLELGMVSHLGLRNPVIQILHGDYDYYYDLSLKHDRGISAYATVASVMADRLVEKLPERKDDIHFLPFPVPEVSLKASSPLDGQLEIIFVGRLTKEKGYDLLPAIDHELNNMGVEVKWHIVGEASEDEKSIWASHSQVVFYGAIPNEQVIALMHNMHCLLLPSLAEGMPVTLVEAMKVGLTCVVNDLRGGIQELIENGITGYKVANNSVTSYANIIAQLNRDRSSLVRIGENASLKASKDFDPVTNTVRYEDLIRKIINQKKHTVKAGRVYGSRLDQQWIPNFITNTIRKLGN